MFVVVLVSPRVPCLLAALVVIVVAGCDGGADPPTAVPSAEAQASTGVPSASTSAGRPSYTAVNVDLCARTDLRPLADLGVTVTRTDPKPPAGRPGAACLFEMRTKAGYQANLRVEASTPSTAEEARLLYRGTRQATGMMPVGAVANVGEEAEAFTKRSEPGFRYAEYMVHARSGNLVVKVWLAVGADSYTPTETLAGKSLTFLKAAQASVPTA
ncbi:hypothetical protein GA0074696_4780 [Micromonospora purpureochromogenes]|uniref:DUF3558 domain-containing protein n=1 Tax=Micromonospora purpureochromogenes TaxID=47872 RepID=A0A1C4ZRX4_9ACTN|nr:hypothetical protein [Micromonospora purpureochromogenes]SCF35524.1 hypothetical protein GA0074696_4780 [Micromonospora purpureochromogenes]